MLPLVELLEQREPDALRRVDELREEVDRIQAERDWLEQVITRSWAGEVLVPVEETRQGHAQGDRTALAAEGQAEGTSSAAKPKSQVPVWCEGLAWSVL